MIELQAGDWCEIKGFGPMACFVANTELPDDVHPRDLVGTTVKIDNQECRVRALEHFAIRCEGTCPHSFGLLVSYTEEKV